MLMYLENMLSEINQRKTIYDITYMLNLKIKQMDIYIFHVQLSVIPRTTAHQASLDIYIAK